ncbi:MAG: hypothetical protein M3Y72_11885 [Acidobacteriota bacterium]|nr:hypothetical protein [Acidobacteriota bacterium]
MRDNPDQQPTNIAVPGLTVGTALTLRPKWPTTDPEQFWATIVLGVPDLAYGSAPTEIELATALQPTVIVEWLGNNDALVPALTGQLNALTPVEKFAEDYEKVVDKLSRTEAALITATIPDVTEVPYFTPVSTIAAQAGLPVQTTAELLGIGPDDYVRPSAQAYVDQILTGTRKGPLPSACPAPLPDLGVPTLPCVLTQADAKIVRRYISCYNLIITATTLFHGGAVVDVHGLVDRIYRDGYKLGSKTLTADFFGGLFSLDGIHPTNTGYGVIANEFIRTINRFEGTEIPAANIDEIFAQDPLKPYAKPEFHKRVRRDWFDDFCFSDAVIERTSR